MCRFEIYRAATGWNILDPRSTSMFAIETGTKYDEIQSSKLTNQLHELKAIC